MNSICVRKATENDNFFRIASCLYLTDPYIYPAAFGNDRDRAARAISVLMSIENCLLSYKNMLVALADDEICGVLLFTKGDSNWELNEYVDRIHTMIPSIDNFIYVSDTYFSVAANTPPDAEVEVIACCVKPSFRNMGIGEKLIHGIFYLYPDCPMSLDVLANNTAAIRLYQKCGFEITESFRGFSMEESSRPDCYRMVKSQ